MTDEGRDAAIDRIVGERRGQGFSVYMWVGFGYDAGTQSRQQPEAVQRLVDAVKLEMIDVRWPSDGSLMYPRTQEALAALASLPSEAAKEPTDAWMAMSALRDWLAGIANDVNVIPALSLWEKACKKFDDEHRHLDAGGGT